MATILLSAITKLCILCHIFWTKHDNTEKVMSTPMFYTCVIPMDYNDTIYSNINCSGEEFMVKSAM